MKTIIYKKSEISKIYFCYKATKKLPMKMFVIYRNNLWKLYLFFKIGP